VSGFPRPSRVAAVPLREIVAATGASVSGSDAAAVSGVTHDSTAVRPGDLYAALPGSRRHGAEFLADALARGAVAGLTDPAGAALTEPAHAAVPLLVVENPRAVLGEVASTVYGRPTARLPVIGLTGTAGKTSTAYLIESGLRAAGHTTCLIGTVETRVADLVVDSVRTTPETTDLHALFAVALESGVTAAVMEVSSHALAYGRVDGVRFAVGGWSNFGLDHLDFHSDVDDYFAAKASLFDGRCRAEVLNLDDPAVRRLVRPGRVTFSASGDPTATWRATDVARDGFAQRFVAWGPGGLAVPARIAMPGRHSIANALLAIACLVEAGVPAATAARGVAECRGVPGRLELVDAPGPVLGVVDYAHKPDAIVAALAALREVSQGRVICVIGAGGDRDRGKRRLMGESAARGADLVVVTDDNPRSEDPATIRAEVLAGAAPDLAGSADDTGPQGAPGPGAVTEVAGRRAAIRAAVGRSAPGDVVALLGKGHERGQEIAGVITPFDDRVELAAALTERYAGVRA
jgi:UDP-N-acetylmuramoyl-L-alanyl-D-glutamate--2,6-diaminopimelate ligase